MNRQPRQLARRSRLQRAQGIELEEKVWRLYVAGKRQVSIAIELELSQTRVCRYVKRRLERIELETPTSPEKLAEMRAIVHSRLEAIYESTFARIYSDDDSSNLHLPDSPKNLGLRLKTIAAMAKLFGLNLEGPKRPASSPQVRYDTPEEVAEKVRAHQAREAATRPISHPP